MEKEEDIATKIENSINSKLASFTDDIKNSIKDIKPKEETKEDDSLWSFLEDDDDEKPKEKQKETYSRKEVENLMAKAAKEIEEKVSSKLDEKVEKKLTTKSIHSEWDNKAFNEFPEMFEKGAFNDEFAKEINAYKSVYSNASDDPMFLYNTAARVRSRMMNEGKWLPKKVLEQQQELENARNNSINFKNVKPKETLKLNEYQKNFAASVGLTPERVAQLREKYS
jgi:hypothetical protein